ncbi:hypothetical protein CHS0354_001454 [Potamilus streckersoni]|uniref:Uncharacterized protein n=1 Tax=Potamilus streckersoni TaxID=2493646 RepID=A0AAE0T7X1_9BIVA|nr:hypothetical protein CHS0354_001454 [Potamilus streckersoni]
MRALHDYNTSEVVVVRGHYIIPFLYQKKPDVLQNMFNVRPVTASEESRSQGCQSVANLQRKIYMQLTRRELKCPNIYQNEREVHDELRRSVQPFHLMHVVMVTYKEHGNQYSETFGLWDNYMTKPVKLLRLSDKMVHPLETEAGLSSENKQPLFNMSASIATPQDMKTPF